MSTDKAADGRRYGKKIATHAVNAAPGQRVDTDIRFKDTDGAFYAKVNGEWLSARDIATLKESITKTVKDALSIDYDLFIEIEKIGGGLGRRGWEKPLCAVRLDYSLIYVSRQTLSHVVTTQKYRLYKRTRVDRDTGEIDPLPNGDGNHYWSNDKVLVPYTPERLATLKRIEAAIFAAREKLIALIDGADTATALDTFNGRLLEAPKDDTAA